MFSSIQFQNIIKTYYLKGLFLRPGRYFLNYIIIQLFEDVKFSHVKHPKMSLPWFTQQTDSRIIKRQNISSGLPADYAVHLKLL